jgi:hypothetical protein
MMRFVVAGSILGLVCLTAGAVQAGSLAEVSAATGVHNTLAGTGSMSAKGTLDAVKRNVPKVSTSCPADMFGDAPRAATKRGAKGKSGKAWASAGGSGARGKGSRGSWATASATARTAKSGWATSKASSNAGSGWGTRAGQTRAPKRR